MQLINTRVTPPIHTQPVPPSVSGGYWRNRYLDPQDNQPFNPRDLTPLERGHVYSWVTDDTGWVHVLAPFRYVDQQAGALLRRIPSFHVCFPCHVPVLGPKTSRNPALAKQRFQVAVGHLPQLRELCAAQGWILEPASEDIGPLCGQMDALAGNAAEHIKQISLFREQVLRATPESPADWMREQEQELSLLIANGKEMLREWVNLAGLLDFCSLAGGRPLDRELLEIQGERTGEALEAVRMANESRYVREIAHRYRQLVGTPDDRESPKPVGPLDLELRMLGVHYPVLHQFKVQGDCLVVEVGECSIRIHQDTVRVEGDLFSLLQQAPQTGRRTRFERLGIDGPAGDSGDK